jgi:hypothetical protein
MAEYLAQIQSDRMGLPVAADQQSGVAERIDSWYATNAPF